MAKVAFRQIDDIIKKARRDDETFRFDTGEDRVEITVKQWLSVEEITGFVDTVADLEKIKLDKQTITLHKKKWN